jgi:type IV pilus assembly protein PilM
MWLGQGKRTSSGPLIMPASGPSSTENHRTMPASPYVWGIDIGKSSLKALRCRVSPTDPRRLVAEEVECIEYPMMLTQEEANPVELVRGALTEFLSRHDLAGDQVAVATPGQSGLAKFIKLPPVEAKKIPDIVKYEAGQQIPFPLDQVVWDWQRLATGIEEGGFVMDAEVALFAMKKEQVAKALTPFDDASIDVEILQLAPIALANMVIFDQLPDPATVDPDDPPPSVVLVSMGVDATDVVVTNGLRVAQRSMPIGGKRFTRALVEEMQYTFAKAETEKRNAVHAADPKAVFRAMRPVFNQFASELQRSLNYFTSTDRSLKIGKVFLIGNAAKLRGLSDFVGKQLGVEVHRLDAYTGLEGPAIAAPAFLENRLGFGTAYGLAVQAAGLSALRTNLLPQEIAFDRMVKAKRPWVVAGLLGLLGAGLVNFIGWYVAAGSYAEAAYKPAFADSDNTKSLSQNAKSGFEAAEQRLRDTESWQRYLIEAHDRRFQALDLMRTIQTLLPRDPEGAIVENPADREEIVIDSLDMEFFPDLATWFAGVQSDWKLTQAAAEADEAGGPAPEAAGDATSEEESADPAAVDPAAVDPGAMPGEDGAPVAGGPVGPGWVVEITGHHFHNERRHSPREGAQFVRSTLIRGLLGKNDDTPLATAAGPASEKDLSVKDLGIGYPVIVAEEPIQRVEIDGGSGMGGFDGRPPRGSATGEEEPVTLRQYSFVLQFVWQPTVPGGVPRAAATAAPAEPQF